MTTIAVPASDVGGVRNVDSRDLGFGAALAALAILVTIDAWTDIFRLGSANEELSYVFTAPAVLAWLAWGRRNKLASCRLQGGWFGLCIIAAAALIHWYGFLTDPVLWRAGAVMLAVGAFVAATGTDVLLRFLPAFAATLFLVPISPNGRYHLAIPLQQATAQATQAVCDVLGITVDRFGSQLTINGVDVTVAEACNGMRMILTLFLVCYAVAFVQPLRAYVRVLFLAASPLVAVAANVARLVPTIWIFGHSTRDVAEAFHTLSGWVMLAVAFGFLLGVFRLLEWAGLPVFKRQSAGGAQ